MFIIVGNRRHRRFLSTVDCGDILADVLRCEMVVFHRRVTIAQFASDSCVCVIIWYYRCVYMLCGVNVCAWCVCERESLCECVCV
jgi:hypothetical protein